MGLRDAPDLDEREQEIYTHLEFEARPGTRVAAARVIAAAEDYFNEPESGVITLHAPKLGALRLAILEFEQVLKPYVAPEVD